MASEFRKGEYTYGLTRQEFHALRGKEEEKNNDHHHHGDYEEKKR